MTDTDINSQQVEDAAQKREMVKSTSIVGGAQVFVILLGIVRTKIIALILGPSGVGVFGMLSSIVDMVRNATSFGINFSGVRDVAQAAESGDQLRIHRIITILRRWALSTGIFGMLVTIALCVPLSNISFESPDYALSIALISVTLVLTSVSAGQLALLQGLRQISQMAKATLYGAVLGTVIVLPLYFWLGINGIVPALILTALGALIISWLFARKIKIIKPKITAKETFKEGLSMAKLGSSVVFIGFICIATSYLVRIVIADKMGMDGVGYFQAINLITITYMSLIINAMQADYLPRLSAICHDNEAVKKLVNNQLEFALCIGAILMSIMITFAPLVIDLLYSSKFAEAVPVLQWQILGAITVFVAWPLEVIFLAKAKSTYYVIINLIWNIVYISIIVLLWDKFGFIIVGIGYITAVISKFIIVYILAKKTSDFKLNKANKKNMILIFSSILLIFIVSYFINNIYGLIVSIILTGILCYYCFIQLNKIINITNLLKKVLPHKRHHD